MQYNEIFFFENPQSLIEVGTNIVAEAMNNTGFTLTSSINTQTAALREYRRLDEVVSFTLNGKVITVLAYDIRPEAFMEIKKRLLSNKLVKELCWKALYLENK